MSRDGAPSGLSPQWRGLPVGSGCAPQPLRGELRCPATISSPTWQADGRLGFQPRFHLGPGTSGLESLSLGVLSVGWSWVAQCLCSLKPAPTGCERSILAVAGLVLSGSSGVGVRQAGGIRTQGGLGSTPLDPSPRPLASKQHHVSGTGCLTRRTKRGLNTGVCLSYSAQRQALEGCCAWFIRFCFMIPWF